MFKLCNRAWALASQRWYTTRTWGFYFRRANVFPRASNASSLNLAHRIETPFPRILDHVLKLNDRRKPAVKQPIAL